MSITTCNVLQLNCKIFGRLSTILTKNYFLFPTIDLPKLQYSWIVPPSPVPNVPFISLSINEFIELTNWNRETKILFIFFIDNNVVETDRTVMKCISTYVCESYDYVRIFAFQWKWFGLITFRKKMARIFIVCWL